MLFLVRCALEFRCGWFGNSNTHRTKNSTTNVVIQQNSRKLLMMDILMSETCWAHKKWNKVESAIKLVFYSSAITIMHGPINIRYLNLSAPNTLTQFLCNDTQNRSCIINTDLFSTIFLNIVGKRGFSVCLCGSCNEVIVVLQINSFLWNLTFWNTDL